MTLELSMEEKIIITMLWVFAIFFLVLVSGIFEGRHDPIKPSNIPPPPPPSRHHPLLFRRRLRLRTKNEEDMLYEAKQGTKAYEYIKGILEAEEKEYQAYMKRVDESVGFKFEKWQGYKPNCCLLREYLITAIWLPTAQYEKLDKKVWKKCDGKMLEDGYYVAVAPNKRYKQGKAIAAVLASYKVVANHFQVMNDLNIGEPSLSRIAITQLFRHKDRIFTFFDDRIRADKKNPDFTEITMGEYEDFVNSYKEG